MKIADGIVYVGVNDHNVDLFEGLYEVPNGMAYNSYVILDEKIAVMDTVDQHFGDEWLNKVEGCLNGRQPDFLIIQHMEPDHSANVDAFLKKYPNATVVGNVRTFTMLKNFFGDVVSNKLEVKDGETLCLGKRTLTFVFAPMVHWPEVMLTYDATDKILFSADAFGKFGALDVEEDWACEARRYYFGIVGKYGMQVQALFKRIGGLQIETICPLHGPVLQENLPYYLNLYNVWSSYGVESEGVLVAYASVYGHTKKAAEYMAEQLTANGCPKVVLTDLARCDMSEAVEDAFRYGKLVLATVTYNLQIFPFMREFIADLTERNYQNRSIAIIGNGSWAPVAGKLVADSFANSKNVDIVGTVTIVSAMTEQNKADISALAKALLEK